MRQHRYKCKKIHKNFCYYHKNAMKKTLRATSFTVCLLSLFFMFAVGQIAFATEVGGNTLDTVRGVEFQVQSAQSTLPGGGVPAYFLELIQGLGIRLSPITSGGTVNDSPYNFALFGLRGIANSFDGWIRFYDSQPGLERFQWSMDPNAADADWNDFGSGSDNDADPTNEIQDVSAGQG